MRQCGFIVTAIDNFSGYWRNLFVNRFFYIINDDITKSRLKRKFDFITCVSTLEHIKKYQVAAKSILSLLKKGGHLVLTVPYNSKKYIENVYKLEGSGYKFKSIFVCQVFSDKELDQMFAMNKVKIVDQEYWQVYSGEYWTFGERLYPPRQVKKEEKNQLTCILYQKI